MNSGTPWNEYALGDIARVFGGGTPSTNVPQYWGGDIPWLVPSEISKRSGLYISSTQRTISRDGLANCAATLLPPGTVMMTSRATIGEVAINTVLMATNQGFINVVCKPELVHNEFFAYWMTWNKQRFIDRAHGVTFKEITKSNFKSMAILLPPLTQQKAIAQLLKAVQTAREARLDELALEHENKASLMAYLFTHGTRGDSRKQTEIGDIPHSWNVSALEAVAKITSGGTPDRNNPEYWNGGIPWVKTGEIRYNTITRTGETISQAGLDNSAAKIIPAGTLLMAMYGQGITRGKVALLGIDAAINQACAAISPRDSLSPLFALYYLQFAYEKIRVLGHGANQKNLNSHLVGSIPLPIPPACEQDEIAGVLQAVDKKLASFEREVFLLEELFTAILERLMTGDLSVTSLARD